MPIVASDWEITRSSGNVRYIGDDHVGGTTGITAGSFVVGKYYEIATIGTTDFTLIGASANTVGVKFEATGAGSGTGTADEAASYATVIEFHRFLQDLADDASSSGDDELDITDELPSSRSTDNIITMLGSYNIDDTAAEHLYDGSIIQGTGGTEVIYDGIVNFGNSDVQIQIIQNGAVLADDWWNFDSAGLNADSAQGISHRFMIKTRTAGSDVDGRRLIGTARRYGKTFSEFLINGTSRGNNVLALTDSDDLNNATAQGTIDAYTDVHLDRTDSTTTVDGVNSTGQAVLNVADGTQFAAGDLIQIAGFNQEYQIASIATNALTLTRNLVDATVGGEIVYDLNAGFAQIDVDNDGSNEDYYAQWDLGAQSVNGFYEYTKNISADGTDHYVYGISGELFRGITHEITVDTPTGTFAAVEDVSWTGGTGQMLAIDSPTAGTKMWIQLLTGVAPTDGLVITGGITSATVTVNVTVTDRSSLISKPFVGQSTGSALIGSYGLTLQTGDLSAADKVFDLTNAQVTPPNNVTFTVGGLVSSEDQVLVGPWDGSTTDSEGNPAVDEDQLTLDTSLTTANVATVDISASVTAGSFVVGSYYNITATGTTDFTLIGAVNSSPGTKFYATGVGTGTGTADLQIPTDTPSAGFIRVEDNDGFYRRLKYSSWTGAAFTIDSAWHVTNDAASDDFDTVAATAPKNVWISYIDEQADAVSESFTGVYNADRDLVVKVRDGGGTPIKEFITSGVLGSNGGSVTAIRTTDT